MGKDYVVAPDYLQEWFVAGESAEKPDLGRKILNPARDYGDTGRYSQAGIERPERPTRKAKTDWEKLWDEYLATVLGSDEARDVLQRLRECR